MRLIFDAILPPLMFNMNDTLLKWYEHLKTVPVTTEPSRHTSRGQRLSAECSPIELRCSVCLARFRKKEIRRKQGWNICLNSRSLAVSCPTPTVVWLPPWGFAFLRLRWLGLVGEAGGSATLVPSDDGARVGQHERRTGSSGGLVAAADTQQTRKEPRTAHDQVCDFTTGGQRWSVGPESGERGAPESLLLASTCHFEPACLLVVRLHFR